MPSCPSTTAARPPRAAVSFFFFFPSFSPTFSLLLLNPPPTSTPPQQPGDWRKSIYRQIGVLAADEQAAAVRQLLADRKYLDASRVGVWGWSAGGSMTLHAMFRYPDLYHCGVAIAFVAHQLLYDTLYQERFMGLPEDNEEVGD